MSISSNDSSFHEGDGDSVRGIRPHIPGYVRRYLGRRGGRLDPHTAGAKSFHATGHTTSARDTGDDASSRTSGHPASAASQLRDAKLPMRATIDFRDDDSWQEEHFEPPTIQDNHPFTYASDSRNNYSKESLTEGNARDYSKSSVNVSPYDRPPSSPSFDTRQGCRTPGSLQSVSVYDHPQEVPGGGSVLFPGLDASLSLEELVDAWDEERDWNDHQKYAMTQWLWQEDQKRRKMLKTQPGHHSDSAKDSSGVIQREKELQYNGYDSAWDYNSDNGDTSSIASQDPSIGEYRGKTKKVFKRLFRRGGAGAKPSENGAFGFQQPITGPFYSGREEKKRGWWGGARRT